MKLQNQEVMMIILCRDKKEWQKKWVVSIGGKLEKSWKFAIILG
jgi:hypothetical protein